MNRARCRLFEKNGLRTDVIYILGSTIDFYAPKFQRVPFTTVGGLRFVLDQVAVRDPRAKKYAPETFMDMRFVKQLEDSGFIKSLYPKG